MPPLIFTDADLDPVRDMPAALDAVADVLAERSQGTASVQTRIQLGIDRADLTLTPGVLERLDLSGLRAVPLGAAGREQLVLVWGRKDGQLQALFYGPRLSVLRTGAIGGMALRLLTAEEPVDVAVIGTGPHAFMQLVAAREVGRVRSVRVYRRDTAALVETAASWSARLELPVSPVVRAEAAVRGAGIVILATTSPTPVIQVDWLRADAYVTSLGPKRRNASELPADILGRAVRIVSDFPEQASSDPQFIGAGFDVEDLSGVHEVGRPGGPGPTLFLSVGLAATEVAVAARLAEELSARGAGRALPAAA